MRSQKDEKDRHRICHTRGQAQTQAISPPDVGGRADHPDRASRVAPHEGLLPRLSPGLAQPFPASRGALGDTGPWPPKLDLSCPHPPSLSQKGKPSQGPALRVHLGSNPAHHPFVLPVEVTFA